MKIAILTLPLHSNYGGIIQNYALQTVLKRMGHEVYTIDCDKSVTVYQDNNFRYKVKKKLQSIRSLYTNTIKRFELISFIRNNINTTSKSIYKINHVDDLNIFFDSVIVGSDQVWRPSYVNPNLETYFLSFIKNPSIKRIAYAVSFGTDVKEFSKDKIISCKKYFELFKAVSVREKSGLSLIDEYNWKCKNEPVLCLDPTLLLSKEEYQDLFDYHLSKGKNLFCYILDKTKDKERLINQISMDTKLKVHILTSHDRFYSLKKWIRAFCDAEYVFTDSFHGCVFSIIFNKPFIAYGNKARGISRFQSLLELFNLQNRLICSIDKYSPELLEYNFDWKTINEKKELYKEESLIFLKNALK